MNIMRQQIGSLTSLVTLLGASLAVLLSPILTTIHVNALSGSEWSAGTIVDDAVFYNNGDMSVASIQTFLNKQVPVCDTQGTQASEYGGGTRAQYGIARGYAPPYVCLKDYYENPTSHANNLSGNPIPDGGMSAAQIIKAAADQYGVSSRVLLTILQKESSGPLITDTWPFPNQYKNAMGYGCPDTAPCDPQYAGFYNQVMNAARQIVNYKNNPTSFRYRANQNNSILYNPNSSCGNGTVYVKSLATAGLYNYTPYQPNNAALNNLYGSGDSCSSYGNRNFWRIFNDWFGTTRAVPLPDCPVQNSAINCVWRLYNTADAQQFLTTSISERNSLVYNQGYLLEGVAYYAYTASSATNIPVYRLNNPGLRAHFWTSNVTERNVLLASGYTDEGIGFYMNADTSTGGNPVYRLNYPPLKKHLWSASNIERTNLTRSGYLDENMVFATPSPNDIAQAPAPPAGSLNVYRFSGLPGWEHFWTASDAERDALINAGYHYEGVTWNAPATATQTPVYRLASPSTGRHFWTTSTVERDILVAYGGYKLEGIGMYGADSATATPVYRLNAPGLGTHLWTTSTAERDSLTATGVYSYEGIAWYQ
jgi:hypothetical protein